MNAWREGQGVLARAQCGPWGAAFRQSRQLEPRAQLLPLSLPGPRAMRSFSFQGVLSQCEAAALLQHDKGPFYRIRSGRAFQSLGPGTQPSPQSRGGNKTWKEQRETHHSPSLFKTVTNPPTGSRGYLLLHNQGHRGQIRTRAAHPPPISVISCPHWAMLNQEAASA